MRRRAGIVVVVTALAVAGCGGGGGGTLEVRTVPRARITEAAAASAASESSRLAFDIEISGDGESFSFTGDGFQTTGGSLDEQRSLIRLEMLDFGDIEIRMIGRDMYFTVGEDAPDELSLPGGATWVHMNSDELLNELPEEERAAAEELFEQQSQYSSTQYLEYLENISSGIEELGTDDVRGVSDTRYRLQLDMEKFSGELPRQLLGVNAEQRELQGAMLGAFKNVKTEVWVDDSGRLVRMEMKFDFSDLDIPDAPPDLTMRMRMDMFDFGTVFDVQPPPVEDTTEYRDLLIRDSV